MKDILTVILSRNGQAVWTASADVPKGLVRRMTADELQRVAQGAYGALEGAINLGNQTPQNPLPVAKKKR